MAMLSQIENSAVKWSLLKPVSGELRKTKWITKVGGLTMFEYWIEALCADITIDL
jgi:hypothetical protein